MGKKPFIDKKKGSVTYNLIHQSTDDADTVPARVLVAAGKGVGVGRTDPDAAPDAADAPQRR